MQWDGVINKEGSCLEVFCINGFLRNFAKLTGKHLCQSLFFNKVAGLRPATLLKKRLWHRCFPVNFAKFLRIPFLTEYIWWLLLKIVETACVCIVFFFHYFKYYDQNIFSRTTVLYLIAKVERKE